MSVNEDENKISINTILPDLAPEEQFKFSLDLALKRKYDEAEIALKEFMALHPNHEKNRDAHYWYGGVMFKQKKYEDLHLVILSLMINIQMTQELLILL